MILILIPITILCLYVARQISHREHTTMEGILSGILLLSSTVCVSCLVYAACVDGGMKPNGGWVWSVSILAWCVYSYFAGQFTSRNKSK